MPATSNDGPAPKATPKKRRKLGKRMTPKDRAPKVRLGSIDGAPVVWVELEGRHGVGKEALLDALDWNRVQKVAKWWTVGINSTGQMHVCNGGIRMNKISQQSETTHPRTILGRFLTRAAPGLIVRHKNYDFLNLRRRNLEVTTRKAAKERRNEILEILEGTDRAELERQLMRNLVDAV
jgi:hypothetical protein